MKKRVLLSLVAVSFLFTACDEKTKEAVSDATSAVTESAKEAAANAVDATKEAAVAAAAAAKEKASEVAEAAKEKASSAIESTKEAASEAAKKAVEMKDEAVEKVAEATDTVKETAANAVDSAAGNEAGKALYAKCAGCHGADGKTKALGKSEIVAGQSVETLVKSLQEYKAGTRNVAGMGTLMKGQVASMSDDDIKAVSEYISAM